MFFSPNPADLTTESDVEQKFAFPLLTSQRPHGLGFPDAEIFTKPNIREFQIGKGTTAKLYYPDYLVTILGLPVLIVEVKKPGEDLVAAACEARLYATELNACYPPGLNPVKFCIVTAGINTQLRAWDSEEILAQFPLDQVGPAHPAFGQFTRLLAFDSLRAHAAAVHAPNKPHRHFRAVSLIGGQTAQNEQIPFNDFGRVLAANFQSIFDPGSYEDRQKVVRDAYVGSPRKQRYLGEIDRIIRNSSPVLAAEVPLIQDPAAPVEVTRRFADLPSLRNKILLLVGAVGCGKSTFVDHLREVSLPDDLKQQTAWVRIDLNPAPVTKDEIYQWLRQQLMAGIRATSRDIDTTTLDNLKILYRQQVQEFQKGEGALFPCDSAPYNDRLADLLAALKQDHVVTIRCLEQFLCTGRGRLLIIVLDNCDKRDRDEQLLMFQVAKYIQQEIRCLVILPLRHQTFENHRHEPPLDTALKDLVYRIEPPPFQEVLKKRLRLVISETRRIGPRSLSYLAGGATIQLPVEKLERFLHAMMGSLFDHKQYGRKIITGLAGWNIRKAFEIFLEFCRSGYIREGDIFERQVKSGDPEALPQATVARVLLRTNRRYYDGDHSFVKNLFQCNPADPHPCSFLRYWILAWLRAQGAHPGPSGVRGYHRQGDLIRDLLSIGADPDAVRVECRYLATAGCVIAEHLRVSHIDDCDLIAITPAGHVHLELAYHDFFYLAACSEDSWVTDYGLAGAVCQRTTKQPFYYGLSWKNTLDNACAFCEYLRPSQENSIRGAIFLPSFQKQAARVNFDKLLAVIKEQQHRVAVKATH